MLNLYTIFHLNLAYSSIEEEQRSAVIEKCYMPALQLTSDFNFPIGFELSCYTLEEIQRIKPEWIELFKACITKGNCELIGSGYTQLIGPLVPSEVNDWNQKLGLETYQRILGIRPKISLINEMAYSAGILDCNISNGYEAIIMEWNNPRKCHPEWKNEWRLLPQYASGTDNKKVPLIWVDSIAFQKFQRYVFDEIDADEYVNYVTFHNNSGDLFFPVYANDIEIFDFRPGRFSTEPELAKGLNEWKRIANIYKILQQNESCRLILPSRVLDVLRNSNEGNVLNLESPVQPVPVKKQEKYNINRWALTGRNDLKINTACYQIYSKLKELKPFDSVAWKELCYLWSSDFRTHITTKRWEKYLQQLNDKLTSLNIHPIKIHELNGEIISLPFQSEKWMIYNERKLIVLQSKEIDIRLNENKGLTIRDCIFKNLSDQPLFGTLDHGFYDDISFGADFYSGHSVIEPIGKPRITDLQKVISEIRTENNRIIFITENKNNDIQFTQHLEIKDKEYIAIHKRIDIPDRRFQRITAFHFTFNPLAWDRNSLYFATHNGGNSIEKFYLKNDEVNHSDLLSSLISARHGMGATKGEVIIGDEKKNLLFKHDYNKCALIPQIVFIPLNEGNYFFRLLYSAQEIDDTFKENDEKVIINTSIKISPL